MAAAAVLGWVTRVGAAVVPLVVAWRRTATALLDLAYAHSVSGPPSTPKRVHGFAPSSTGRCCRSPVVVTAVLTPLVTSLLSVVVPPIST